MDKPDSPIKTALQKLRLPKPRGSSAPSSSPASETAQLPVQDSEKLSGKHSGSAGTDSTSEWELPELSDTPQHPQREPSAKEKVDTSGATTEKTSAESKLDHLDPKVAGAVLVCSLLVLWRPSFSLLLALLAVNIVLGFALVMVCGYIRQFQLGSFGPSTAAADSPDADVKSTVGLQQLLSPGWIRMRTIVNQRDFRGVVTAVELGAQPPEVTFVRSANSPCDGVVCYNIGLNLCAECAAAPGIPYVQMEVKVPGYSNPWVFRMKLLALDITVQLYFWSSAPEGRGSGRPYSLIEAALCPEPAKPHLVKVALETISHSPIFESVLSRCEPVASAVICSHVLPRFTGFQNRVILEEGQAVAHIKKKESAGWQQNARRAGWQPRAEAAVESAVGQMFSEAGGFAYEAMANTAASAAAQAAGAARLLKSSFGMDH